jgi:hypothetical protein
MKLSGAKADSKLCPQFIFFCSHATCSRDGATNLWKQRDRSKSGDYVTQPVHCLMCNPLGQLLAPFAWQLNSLPS